MTSNSAPPANPTYRSPEGAASADATAAYAQRHRASYTADFYRSTGLGLTASSIGIGTYLGDCSDEDDQAYLAAIGGALARGVNLIDAASNYRAQRSERVVGQALRDAVATQSISRSSVIVCSKGGYIPFDGAPPASRKEYQGYLRRTFLEPGVLQADQLVGGGHSLWPRFLQYCIARSRQNLGVRTIDVYYLHNPEQQLATVDLDVLATRVRAAFATLEESVARGDERLRVRDMGWVAGATGDAGHLSIEWLVGIAREVAGDAHHFRALQLPINLAMPEAVRSKTQSLAGIGPATVLEAADAFGLTVVASAPLLQGRLTSGLPNEVRSAVTGHATDAQRALAFVRGIPGLSAAVVGMKSLAHLEENLASAAAG